jgi:hypothetical protein
MMGSISSSARRRLLWMAIVAAWFLCPLPNPSPMKTIEADRKEFPGSAVIDEPFVCERDSNEMALDASCRLTAGRLEVELLDAGGRRLAGPFVITEDKDENDTFVTDDAFQQGQSYRLRCSERGAVGHYRVSISQPWPIAVGFGERYLAALVVLAVGFVATGVLGLFGVGGSHMRQWCGRFAWIIFLAAFWLSYPITHEYGHILALKAFGAYDSSMIRFLPVGGAPHVGGQPSACLRPWQIAATAIAGSLLPTLLAYVSFAAWLSPLGRTWRERHLHVDMGWSVLTLTLVFPQAVPIPMLFPGLVSDRDYSLFVQNVGPHLWIAISALCMIALINLTIVVWIVKHWVSRARAVRAGRGRL